jgi:hypothetical protein
MAYVDIYTEATTADSLLRKQIAVALHKAATDIAAEAENTANHAQRLAWARRVFADPTSWATKVVWTVMQNATIASTVPTTSDSDVQFVVNSNIANFLTLV